MRNIPNYTSHQKRPLDQKIEVLKSQVTKKYDELRVEIFHDFLEQ